MPEHKHQPKSNDSPPRHVNNTPSEQSEDATEAGAAFALTPGLMGLSSPNDSRFIHSTLGLQRMIGNAATRRVLANRDLAQRRIEDRQPDTPLPERTAIRATGSYEAIDPDGSNRITLQLNQAGYFIQGWYQRRSYRSHSAGIHRQQMYQHTIEADMIEDNADNVVYAYRRMDSAGREVSSGEMTIRNTDEGVQLVMRSGGWSQAFRQTSTSARPPDAVIENLPEGVRDEIAASIEAPLDSNEEEILLSRSQNLKRLIREYLAESRMMRMAIASQLNSAVSEIFRDFARQQVPLVRHRLRGLLVSENYTNNSTQRSYWDWMQVAVIEQPGFTESVQNWLELRATGDAGGQHRYRYMITVAGLGGDVGIGLGGYAGSLIIEKLEPDTWTHEYAIGFGQVSGGLSAGVTTGFLFPWTEFETVVPWAPENFEGWCFMTGAGASGSAVAGGGYSPLGLLVFEGDGTYESLGVPTASVTGEAGVHVGAELGASIGYIGDGRDEVLSHLNGVSTSGSSPTPLEGRGADTGERTIHFEVDNPSLSADGMEAIRQMCAQHLLTFQQVSSQLRVDGYTSTTGSDAHNLRLSELRALNTVQYIRDVLGEDFRIADDHISTTGHGETPARDTGEADATENEAWRKVEVRLNGNVVLTLQ
jgi:outer membrane protein OmpA-like peptidoglycan-associated protein